MKHLAATAILSVLLALPASAQSAQDGEKVFKKCAACHKVGTGAKNGVGPILTDVIGRTAGTAEGYKYSKYMVAAGQAGLVWSDETIFEYVADPTKFLRAFLDDTKAKAKMRFKLKKEADRRAVIAYLASFSTASATPEDMAPTDGFCIENASEKAHFFAVETREGARQFTQLEPGARLCSAATSATDGVVSVFEDAEGFEGCSRIVATGKVEGMIEYAEFDRCRWSSQG